MDSKDVFSELQEINGCPAENILQAKQYVIEHDCAVSTALEQTKCGTKKEILSALSKAYSIQAIANISNVKFDPSFITKFTPESIIRLQFIPLQSKKGFNILVVNPQSTFAIEDCVRSHLAEGDSSILHFFVVLESDFLQWTQTAGVTVESAKLNALLEEVEVEESKQEFDVADTEEPDQASIINIVNRLIIDAYQKKASDIHIEAMETELRIRFRIDGILIKQAKIDRGLSKQIANRIKVMSNMNTTNTKTPQSGKLHIVYKGEPIDARVSTVPGLYGEVLIIRLLNNSDITFQIDSLGFRPEITSKMRNIMHMPNGILLVTGPTGSGKSSTLAAMMTELNTIDKSIISIEDPVEYRVPGITQVNVNNDINLTFALTLREALRQDPDIIMVGEIRDTETARIAISASNTGHMVLSTLHTNSACTSIVRLTEMGVEPFMVASSVRGIVNQKLVRCLCPACKEEYIPTPEASIRNFIHCEPNEPLSLYRPVGCPRCNGTGYVGRTVLVEFLEVGPEIRKAVLAGADSEDLHDIAIGLGMRTALEDGIKLVLEGKTSAEEINRVINAGL